MNIFVPALFLVSLTLAEPPVGDGYPASRSNDHHHSNNHDHDNHSGHQRSLSEEYGPPSSSRNDISDDYSRNSRTQHERQAPSSSTSNQRHPASARSSENSHNHSAATRNFNDNSESTITHGYAYTRSGSSQKSSSSGRSLSERHGFPEVSARTLSTEYGMPDVRSTPSEEYGVPIMARQTKPVSFRTSKASRDNSRPVSGSSSTEAHSHSYPALRSNTPGYERNASAKSNFASEQFQTYGVPKESFEALSRSLSTDDNQSKGFQGSGASSHQHSEVNGASARALSQEYEVPSSRANYDEASYNAPSRSSSSSSYPAARNTMPSQEYGVPEQNKGYEDARSRALNELLNQEPASYDFAYQIEDQESGVDFGHTETREANRAEGSYFVVLPDGTKQTVEYEADERGFKPRISVEPAAAGYDDNAQDLARSAGGPY